jgi:hypothetical protein
MQRLEGLLGRRWAETRNALGPLLVGVDLTWALGDYPHFRTKRGYGVTFHKGPRYCHLLFAKKMLRAPEHRVDGILRHELGHVVDLTVDPAELNRWAAARGTRLPSTVERRADAVAEAIWRSAIKYDTDLVQSTTTGVFPRPAHLGY